MRALVEQLEPGLDRVLGIVGQELGVERLRCRHLALARLQQAPQAALTALAQVHRERRCALTRPSARVGLVDAQLADLRVIGADAAIADQALTQQHRASTDGTAGIGVLSADLDHRDSAVTVPRDRR